MRMDTFGKGTFSSLCRIICLGLSLNLITLVSSENVNLLADESIGSWKAYHELGKSKHGFSVNSSAASVCDVGQVQNLLVSPIIDVSRVNALWINIRYTIHECKAGGEKCNEYLKLHKLPVEYDEFGNPKEFTAQYFNKQSPKAIGTLDKPFPNSKLSHTEEIDSSGYQSQKIRLVLESPATCADVFSARVSFRQCPEITRSQAVFNESSAPFSPSLSVQGRCVEWAQSKYPPSFSCKSDGQWDEEDEDLVTDLCKCKPGYEPKYDSCSPCGRSFYKDTISNDKCRFCPLNSYSRSFGATFCECDKSYYRADHEPKSMACGTVPGKPENATYIVYSSHVTINWRRPFDDGGRPDITYSVICTNCPAAKSKQPKFNILDGKNIRNTSIVITNLEPNTEYRFQIEAENAISRSISQLDRSYAQVKFTTKESPQIELDDYKVLRGNWVELRWLMPMREGEERSRQFMVTHVYRGQPEHKFTERLSYTFTGLDVGLHEFRVAFKDGTGASSSVQMHITQSQMGPEEEELKKLVFTVGVVLTVVLVLVVACLTALCCYRKLTLSPKHYPMPTTPTLGAGGAFYPHQAYTMCYPSMDPTYSPSCYGGASDKLTVGGVSFVEPGLTENLEQLIRECGVGEFEPERLLLSHDNQFNSDPAHLKGSFGFERASLIEWVGNETVQVPVLVKGTSEDLGEKRLFLQEVAVASQLSYDPNVLKLCGLVRASPQVNPAGEISVAVFESIDCTLEFALLNNTLWQRTSALNKMNPPQSELMAKSAPEIHIMRGVAAGMQFLSELGYIHKVLRARNVYLTEEGTPKIGGFHHRASLEDQLMDTSSDDKPAWEEMLPWMAPEVVDCGKFSTASDVWAFGVLVWEIVAQGDRPWGGKHPHEISKAILSGVPLPVSNTPCSVALYNLMLACWSPDTKRRPLFSSLAHQLFTFIKQRDSLAQQVGTGGTLPRRLDIDSSNYATTTTATTVPGGAATWGSGAGVPNNQRRIFTIQECLTSLKLAQYNQNFIQHGLHLLDELVEQPVDHKFLKQIGMNSEKHRKQLLRYLDVTRQQQQQKQMNLKQSTLAMNMNKNPAVSVL